MSAREKNHTPLIACFALVGATSVAARIAGMVMITAAAMMFIIPSCMAQSVAAPTPGGAVIGSQGEVQFTAGLEHGVVLQGAPGQAYLVIDLNAARAQNQTVRPGMGVALVIDRSGSMRGDKMPNAILAASSFIQNMVDGDVVSIFQYDDVVEQLAAPTIISAATRPQLIASLSTMYPRGSTNLHGGLVAGIASLQQASSERPIRRVILISDGLANVGPSSPVQLGHEAARAASAGISVTAIGVGLNYDESTLGALAVRSGGRFYHLQDPSQMAAILESEMAALTRTVARNVIIDFAPAPGVQFLSSTGADVIRNDGQIQLRVGDLLGGINRPVVVALRVPTRGRVEHDAATIGLSYTSALTGENRNASTAVQYQLGRSQAAVASSINPRYAVAVETHRAAEANQRAAALLQQGHSDRAADVLQAQAQQLERRAERLPRAERARMEAQARRLRSSGRAARQARRPAARRARSLQMSDDALEGLGF